MEASSSVGAHPLADALIERLRGRGARVLELGAGSGRNTAALQAAGFDVRAIRDDDVPEIAPGDGAFDAALSTHALLHGTPAAIACTVQKTARALKPHAPFYCTFSSKRDARCGRGRRIADDTYAPLSGDEAGVPHAYFDEAGLRAMLQQWYEVESLQEHEVDTIVGRWAHAQPRSGAVHWFLRARKL